MPLSSPLPASTTALVLIDLQTGIVQLEAEPHSAAAVVERAVELADAFRLVGALVIAVHVGGRADGADRLSARVDEPVGGGARPAGFADLVPEVAERADVVVLKRQWGAFYGTDLDLHLRRRGIGTIVLAGISTNAGVESTARDGWERSYEIVIAEDATSARAAADHEFAITRILPRISRLASSAEVVAHLSAD